MKNERYWLFSMNAHEAKGGLDDLRAMSNDIEELHSYPEKDFVEHDLYYVVDTQTWEKIDSFDMYDKKWVPVNMPIEIFHKE